jgi:hypothetical protein
MFFFSSLSFALFHSLFRSLFFSDGFGFVAVCGFEGDGGVRLGFGLVWVCGGSDLFVGLREMAGRQ